MRETHIYPQAVVEDGATIGDGVTIEPFAVVKGTVTLGDNVTIKSHAYIDGNTTIGDGTIIYPSASIGTRTQDLKYNGETTYVKIGKNCQIREFVTINSSTSEGSVVEVGDSCLIMAYCHVAHHCKVGSHVIMSNNSLLAGHVLVEDYAIIGGMTPVHQYTRIGCHAMVGGMSRVTEDIPPYTLGGGIPYNLGGINRVGLKRREFPFEVRRALSQTFRLVYRSRLLLPEALDKVEQEVELFDEVKHFVDFCRASKRGLIGMQGVHKGVSKHTQKGELDQESARDLLVELAEKSS